MRFEQLEFFVELARSSSFTHACKNLHITRQALSASIKNLEQELDAELLIRDVTGVTLTEKGFKVLKFAEDILERQKEFYVDFFELQEIEKEEIHIKIQLSDLIYSYIYPELFTYFYKNYSNIHIEVEKIGHCKENIFEEITSDIAIIPVVVKEFHELDKFSLKYEFVPIFECKPFVWVSKKSSLSKKKYLEYTDYSRYPSIKIIDFDQCLGAKEISEGIFCSSENSNISFSINSSSVHLLENLIEQDMGIRLDYLANEQSMFGFLESNANIKKVFIRYPFKIMAGYLIKKEERSPAVSLIVNYLNKKYIE